MKNTIRAPVAAQPPDAKKTSFDPEEFLNEWVFTFAKGIAAAILPNKKAMERWVNENKKKYESRSFPGLTRDRAYTAMTEMKAFINALKSFLAGLAPGPFEIPAAAAALASEWAIKAEIIYAVEYLYGEQPEDAEDFAMDILAVIAGPSLLEEVISYAADKAVDAAGDIAKELAKKAGKALLKKVLKNAKVKKALRTELGKKLRKKIAALGNAAKAAKKAAEEIGEELTPVTKVLSAVADGFFAYNEIVEIARNARAHCFKFPSLSGTYINLTAEYGAALVFNKNGSVAVRPRFPKQGSGIGDIREGVTLGGGEYTIQRDVMTIKFGKVSWKDSNYNAPRPTATYPFTNWDFINVEPDLSNKTIKLTLSGECEFKGLRASKWELLSYIDADSYKAIHRSDDKATPTKPTAKTDTKTAKKTDTKSASKPVPKPAPKPVPKPAPKPVPKPAPVSIDGVWAIGDNHVAVKGSTGVFKKVPAISALKDPVSLDAAKKGYVKVGTTYWRNIERTGNLTWSGQVMIIDRKKSSQIIVTGISYRDCTFKMSSNEKTMTCNRDTWKRQK